MGRAHACVPGQSINYAPEVVDVIVVDHADKGVDDFEQSKLVGPVAVDVTEVALVPGVGASDAMGV
ncbi:hypothetical protein [Actinopolymorpha sp. B11F2]|uniref:hypothetical protein n=1 Tax=Actinopolymorpha sp. B11F2 TaxID=3160862 RepID=UPI0032E4F07A